MRTFAIFFLIHLSFLVAGAQESAPSRSCKSLTSAASKELQNPAQIVPVPEGWDLYRFDMVYASKDGDFRISKWDKPEFNEIMKSYLGIAAEGDLIYLENILLKRKDSESIKEYPSICVKIE